MHNFPLEHLQRSFVFLTSEKIDRLTPSFPYFVTLLDLP